MPTINMSEALEEAYATADTKAIPYGTLEFVHPLWDTPARILDGWDQIEARLETPSDSGHAGELVTFYPVPIDWVMPVTTPDEVPSFQFKFYDPSRMVMQKIFDAQDDPQPIQMYVRIFLSNHLDIGPETVPVPRYHVASVKINARSSLITGRCIFQDYMGRSAPFRTYTLAEFPGLRRR
jgi:hypothetical protein